MTIKGLWPRHGDTRTTVSLFIIIPEQLNSDYLSVTVTGRMSFLISESKKCANGMKKVCDVTQLVGTNIVTLSWSGTDSSANCVFIVMVMIGRGSRTWCGRSSFSSSSHRTKLFSDFRWRRWEDVSRGKQLLFRGENCNYRQTLFRPRPSRVNVWKRHKIISYLCRFKIQWLFGTFRSFLLHLWLHFIFYRVQ